MLLCQANNAGAYEQLHSNKHIIRCTVYSLHPRCSVNIFYIFYELPLGVNKEHEKPTLFLMCIVTKKKKKTVILKCNVIKSLVINIKEITVKYVISYCVYILRLIDK